MKNHSSHTDPSSQESHSNGSCNLDPCNKDSCNKDSCNTEPHKDAHQENPSKPRRPKALSAVTDAFIEHGTYLKAFLRRFMHRQDDIEDIAQEAFIRAFKVEQDSTINHPKTLLFTIAKNIALNELRTKSRRVTDYIEECSTPPEMVGATIEEELEALDKLETYCVAVDNLPPQCRRVYLLRKVHGLRHKDIAEKLNISLRSVERHLQKGAIRCRESLRKHDNAGSQASTPLGSARDASRDTSRATPTTLQKERAEQ